MNWRPHDKLGDEPGTSCRTLVRAVLTNLGNVTIEVPSRKTFEAEGAILKQALSDCLRDQRAALAQLADAARQVDKAAFESTADFGPAH